MVDKLEKYIKKSDLLIVIIIILGVLFIIFGKIPQSEAQKMVQTCRGLENREMCYSKAFANFTKGNNMQEAFKLLYQVQEIDQDARGCHFIAHSISIAETEKDPSKWKEVMNNAPQNCSYGGAHGALEVHASTFPDGKLPKSEIPVVCNNPDTNNCTHILGHLLLVLNEDDIDASLDDCALLPHDVLGKFECLTGVFMERITAFNLVEHGLADENSLDWSARVPELETLCRKQSGANSVACWKEIVHAVLVKVRNDPQKLVDFCEMAPNEESTRECIDHALGIIAASYNFELARMKPICEVRVRAENFKNRCYAHLVSSTLSTVPQEKSSALKFCQYLEKEYQQSCLTMVDRVTKYRDTITNVN